MYWASSILITDKRGRFSALFFLYIFSFALDDFILNNIKLMNQIKNKEDL